MVVMQSSNRVYSCRLANCYTPYHSLDRT